MFHGHAVCWVLAETLEAARLGAEAVEVDYEPLPSLITVTRGDRGQQLPGRPAPPRARRRRGRPRGLRARLQRRVRVRRPGALLPRDALLAGPRRRGRPGLRPEQHPAPLRDPGDRRPRARPAQPRGHRPVPADGRRASAARRCSRTAYAAIAALGATLTGRPVRLRLNRTQDITMSGKRHGFHARWRVGFDDERPPPGARRDADLRRRLEPRPVRAGAGPRAVPHRQRLLDAQRPRERPDREDQQDLADRVPRLRRSAGDARDRGHPRPLRAAARRRPGRAAAPQLLPRRPGDAVRPAGPARRAAGGRLAAGRSTPATSPPGPRRSRGSTRRIRTPSAGWRSRRSSSASRSTSPRSTRPAPWCTSTRTARC